MKYITQAMSDLGSYVNICISRLNEKIYMLKRYIFDRSANFKRLTAVLAVLIIGVTGTLLLLKGHASVPSVTLSADQGTLSGPATVQSCAGASDGNCVVFGSSTGGTARCPLTTSFSATYQPSCWLPFLSTSPLNTPLPASPKLATYSSTVINHLLTYNWQFPGGSSAFSLPGSSGSRPSYFANPADPLIKISSCSGRCLDQNGVSIVGSSFHIPKNAVPGGNTDSHLDVIETDTGNEYDFWQASVNYTTGTMTATNGDLDNVLTGTGVQLKVGADAAGFSLLGGLLRPSELLDNTNSSTPINHALVLDVGCVANGSTSGIPSSVYPSITRGSDGCIDSSKGDGPPYGSLFKLNMSDSEIAASGAPSWEQTIMKTISHYGAYVSDTQSVDSMYIFAQTCDSWTTLGVPDLFQKVDQQIGTGYYSNGGCNYGLKSSIPIPVNKLEVVDPCVPKKTC